MARVSVEVENEVVRRFSTVDAAGVLAALGAMDDPPSEPPEWARARARVHLALVKLSNGDRAAFDRQLELAQMDWRDTLCAAGLENADWPEVLRAAGYSVPK
jgi:hypothetical protein